MNILVLTHHRLHSLFTGATTRILSLAQELARKGNQVNILCLISPRYAPARSVSFAEKGHVYEARNPLQWSDSLNHYFKIPPYSFTSYLNAFFSIPPLVSKTPVDIVISESPFLWQVAKKIPARLKVLSAHNYEFDYHQHYSPLTKVFIREIEKKALREAQLVIAVSEIDRNQFSFLTSPQKIELIPNGFQHGALKTRLSFHEKEQLKKKYGLPPQERTALVLASPSFHNREALDSLNDAIKKTPLSQWNILVVGGGKSSGIPSSSFHFLGPQPDLTDFFALAELGLNPVVSGSGSNLKLIECLGKGLPVLSTPFGSRGFEKSLRGIYLDEIHNFPKRLNHQETWEAPDLHQLSCYQWSSLGARYDSILRHSLSQRELPQ